VVEVRGVSGFSHLSLNVHDRAAHGVQMNNDSFSKCGTFWSGLGGPFWAVFAYMKIKPKKDINYLNFKIK
jgi:hypothetical protein